MQPTIYADSQTHFIVGSPIEHSLSPAIFNTLYAHYDMNILCQTANVPKGELSTFLATKDMLRMRAMNITIPHKVDIIPFIEHVDPLAKMFQSVNSVCWNEKGESCGYSTDAQGFSLSLQDAGVSLAGQDVLMLGAGGAAAPLALQTAMEDAKSITILARRQDAAERICTRLKENNFTQCVSDKLEDAAQYTPASTLLINTTPLGMSHFPTDFEDLHFIDLLPKEAVVCDIVYNPAMTSLLTHAQKRGLKIVGGIGMLIWQAFAGFEKYYGILPSRELIQPILDSMRAQGHTFT